MARLVYICLLLSWVLGSASVVSAQAQCEMDKTLAAFLGDLATVSSAPGSMDEHAQAALQYSVDAMRQSQQAGDGTVWRDPTLHALTLRALRLGETVLMTGRIETPDRVMALVQRLHAQWQGFCSEQSALAATPSTGETIGHSVSFVPGSAVSAVLVPLEVQALRMGSVLAGLIAFAFTLVLLEFGVRRLHLAVFDRRTCLIPARLDTGTAIIDGAITEFSRDDARFEPSNVLIFDFNRGDLLIGNARFPARVAGEEDALACSFRNRLSLQEHRIALSQSLLGTHAVGARQKAREAPLNVPIPRV